MAKLVGPKGASESEHMDRLQHAGLAATIGTIQQIDPRGGIQLNPSEVTQILYLKLGYQHS